MSDHPDPFEWSGGHPALDFVNTLDERPFEQPIENLATYRDLVRFAELAKLIEPSVAAPLPCDTRQTDPNLAAVIDAWDRLPEAVRAGIVAMVRAAGGGR